MRDDNDEKFGFKFDSFFEHVHDEILVRVKVTFSGGGMFNGLKSNLAKLISQERPHLHVSEQDFTLYYFQFNFFSIDIKGVIIVSKRQNFSFKKFQTFGIVFGVGVWWWWSITSPSFLRLANVLLANRLGLEKRPIKKYEIFVGLVTRTLKMNKFS